MHLAVFDSGEFEQFVDDEVGFVAAGALVDRAEGDEHVADVVGRSIGERVQGAQWVVWPGVEPHVNEWSPAVEPG